MNLQEQVEAWRCRLNSRLLVNYVCGDTPLGMRARTVGFTDAVAVFEVADYDNRPVCELEVPLSAAGLSLDDFYQHTYFDIIHLVDVVCVAEARRLVDEDEKKTSSDWDDN